MDLVETVLEERSFAPEVREAGIISSIGRGVARVKGLPGARYEELIRFQGNRLGIVFNLDPDEVAVVLLDQSEDLDAGSQVARTGRVMDVPVGEALMGRVIDPMGRPLDDKGAIRTDERRGIEQDAPAIMDRDPVEVPLQTGIQVIDALVPIGRGQRELIVGDRQTGKSAIAIDTIINQKDKDVRCIYCAIGKRNSSTARVIRDLSEHDALDNTIVVATSGEDPPGLKFAAPYAATSIAEYFMEKGEDVLVVFDDVTRHARAYREISLLLRRPPGREAYPGDIFYIHSRLLERATHLNEENGGGSLTALPIVETQAQNISAYIPTNLISITDGQIYLSPDLFHEGILPAVDVGKSVSRVGGKTQLPAYRAVAGDLRLSYSQFEELEAFARFGTQLDEETKQTLHRGRRVREVLKQSQYQTTPVPEQIAVLLAVTKGLFDKIELEDIREAKEKIRSAVRDKLEDVSKAIMNGEELEDDHRKAIVETAREALGEHISSEAEEAEGAE
jgi:F-type H+-transporting ATPase subunit alpha